jgi:hypothetical protein
MTWDVTVTDTLAESYLSEVSSHAGSVAEGATNRKELKYQSLATTHTFIPLALETLGPINSASPFLTGWTVALLLALVTREKLLSCFSAYH